MCGSLEVYRAAKNNICAAIGNDFDDLVQVAALALLEHMKEEDAFIKAVNAVHKAIRTEANNEGVRIRATYDEHGNILNKNEPQLYYNLPYWDLSNKICIY